MSSDEEMEIDEVDATPIPKLDKGKGKQVDTPLNGTDENNLPWVEKYRPKSLSDVVSHQDIIGTSKVIFGIGFMLISKSKNS